MASIITERTTQSGNDLRWNLLQAKALELRVARAFALFNNLGIQAILIKGWAIARLYPADKPRVTTDIDLAVSAKDYDAASHIADSADAQRLAIDLHRELRHLDTVEWTDLLDNSLTIYLDGVPIRVLRPEDHLRVLCVHWLTDGGEFKERLWDIVYLIQSRPSDFDWDRCLNVVSPVRRRWLLCTLGLAHRYIGLDLDGTPIVNETRNLPAWLIRAVERAWASSVRLRPLHSSLNDRKVLIQQIVKRLRPNPIQATIDMEGSFDAKTRVFYQIGSILKRFGPSLRRISGSIWSRSR